MNRLMLLLGPGGSGDGLGMSRALGDFRFKRNTLLESEDQIVTANPSIISHQITEEDEFLILATDGSSYMSISC
jgi:protein phosphatase 2C family protein 2/3